MNAKCQISQTVVPIELEQSHAKTICVMSSAHPCFYGVGASGVKCFT